MSDTVERAQTSEPAGEPPHRASDVAPDTPLSPSNRRGGRRIARRVASLAVVALVVFLLTPTGCYLSRAGWEEAKILAGRRKIVRLVDDASTDASTRARLQLV